MSPLTHGLNYRSACDLLNVWQSTPPSLKQSAQVQYNYSIRIFSCIVLVRTPAIQRCNTSSLQLAENLQATCSSCKTTCMAVVLCLCGPLQYNAATQVLYNLQKTCRLLAAVVKQLVWQLYCACADCCNTTKFLCYFIVVVLHLCEPL